MSVWASYYEIYGGKLFDLLNNRKKLVCREDGSGSVNIVGLQVCFWGLLHISNVNSSSRWPHILTPVVFLSSHSNDNAIPQKNSWVWSAQEIP